MNRKKQMAAVLTVWSSAVLCAGKVQVTSDCPEGTAQPGQQVVFQVRCVDRTPADVQIRVRRFCNGLMETEQNYPADAPVTLVHRCSGSGWVAVTAERLDGEGKPVAPPRLDPESGCGVVIVPENICRSRPRPRDFDAYWQNRIAELRRFPIKATRTPVAAPSGIRCEDLQIAMPDNIPVSGYLMMPSNVAPGTLPCVVYFHGAGIRSAQKQPEFARRAIVLDVNAHGVPNGKDPAYYRELMKNDGRDRVFRNRANLKDAYLNGMFLRVVRSLDFIRTMPEWDGKTRSVFGRSQGGAQAIVAAALVPEVTLCIANVPALGDHGGYAFGRRPGWPRLNRQGEDAPDPEKLAAVSDYFDIVNFASMIHSPISMTAGLIDFTCPPTSILAAYSELPLSTKRAIEYFPALGHAAPPAQKDGRELIKKELEP